MMRREIMAECLVVVWDQAPQWGKRQKKQGLIGKISLSEASRAVAWGGGKGCHPFPSPDYLSARFAHQFFFFPPIFPQCRAWSQASLVGIYVTQWILRDKGTATIWDYGISCRNSDNAGSKGGWVYHFTTLGRKK